MDLREAGVRERGATLVGPPDGGDVAALRIGGEIVNVAVATRRQNDGVGHVGTEPPAHEVAHHDPAGRSVEHDQVEHLVARVHPHLAAADLPRQGLIGSEQQLLPRLAARVESPRNLHAAEGAIREQAAVLAREGDPLGHTLIDDVDAQLRQPVHARLARAEVSPLQRVVKQPEDRVAVILIVLGRVDPPLRGDRVRAPGRVLETEARNPVAQLRERCRRRSARQPRADHQDVVLGLVGRGHEPDLGPVSRPLGLERPGGHSCVERRRHRSTPASTATGIVM